MHVLLKSVRFLKKTYDDDDLQKMVNFTVYNALEADYNIYQVVEILKHCEFDNMSIMETLYYAYNRNSLFCFEEFPDALSL